MRFESSSASSIAHENYSDLKAMAFPMRSADNMLATTAEEEAYTHILAGIRSGRFAPNDRLIPEEIAAEIGMSRMPVREAFRRLATEGLVTIRPNRGCVVSGLTRAEISEVFEIRSVLEGLAARLATPKIDPDALSDLRHLLQRMKKSEAGKTENWLAEHYRFHEYLFRLSGRPKLIAQIRTLHVAIEPYLRLYRHHAVKYRSAGEAHEALLKILAKGDAAAAERAMRDHVLGTLPLLSKFLDQLDGDKSLLKQR
jgi:DNA-binding GntR family transcriptional regulator